jgi:hypothetical protein
MPNTSAFTGEYTNIGNRRVRKDDVANPTLETSATIIEQPEGYIFDSSNHNNNKIKHPITGVEWTAPASFACFAGSMNWDDFIGYHDGPTGDADEAEVAIEAVTFAAITGVTGVASTDLLTKASHGLVNGDTVILTLLGGSEGTGLSNNVPYAVVGVSGNDFQLSLTVGGAAINFTTNIVDCTVRKYLA